MASYRYVYSTEHIPLDLNIPLWKLRTKHTLEWEAIVKTLEESPKELFQTLLSAPDVKPYLNQSYKPTGKPFFLFYAFLLLINLIREDQETIKQRKHTIA